MKDADAQQAIHHAVRNGDIGLTSLLLSKGAKLDDETDYGWSPIHLASAYGHVPLVAEFITRGISIEQKLGSPDFRPGKKTNEAARKGYWAEIRWPHPGARPLHLALEFGQDEVANMLLASGAKTDEADSKYWRPLHYAAFNCRIHMVEMLLGRGASPHATTDDGNTALGLGFREHGLFASYEDKEQIHELLHSAMNAHRKSKFKQLTRAMSAGGNKSRDAGERNRAWHTAELAAALYQDDLTEEGVGDEDEAQLAPSMSTQEKGDDNWENDGSTKAQASSSRANGDRR